jgi:hypothetical protein
MGKMKACGVVNVIVVLLFMFISKSMAVVSAATDSLQYEYLVVEVGTWTYKKDDDRRKQTLVKYPMEFGIFTSDTNISNKSATTCLPALDEAVTLNELGKLGWELITVCKNNETGKEFGYFRRQLTQRSQQ